MNKEIDLNMSVQCNVEHHDLCPVSTGITPLKDEYNRIYCICNCHQKEEVIQ